MSKSLPDASWLACLRPKVALNRPFLIGPKPLCKGTKKSTFGSNKAVVKDRMERDPKDKERIILFFEERVVCSAEPHPDY